MTDEATLSFAELAVQSGRLAGALAGLGIDPGDKVTLYSPNCWEWVVSYFGTLMAGAVVNPVNVMLTPEVVFFPGLMRMLSVWFQPTEVAKVITWERVFMVHELHAQGVSISAIARQTGLDRKTVRRHLAAGIQPPVYGPRTPQGSLLDRFTVYLQARLDQYPGLSGSRLLREIQAQGYTGGYTILTDYLRTIRPPQEAGYEVRFETPAGPPTSPQGTTGVSPTSISKLPHSTRRSGRYPRLERLSAHRPSQGPGDPHMNAVSPLEAVKQHLVNLKMAAALLDRLLHHAIVVETNPPGADLDGVNRPQGVRQGRRTSTRAFLPAAGTRQPGPR